LFRIMSIPTTFRLFLVLTSLVATSADSVPSSYLVRITIAPIGTTFGNLQWRRY
jgi:hypothetical protein